MKAREKREILDESYGTPIEPGRFRAMVRKLINDKLDEYFVLDSPEGGNRPGLVENVAANAADWIGDKIMEEWSETESAKAKAAGDR